ncbi:MAG TPA: SPFH domain-containing protein [Phycisphaerae bacterium]|nr:SPFH domain-containing protein [Phycisphaerae bacterium]
MNAPDKRGEIVSGLGLLLCLVGAALLFVLAIWADSSSVFAAAFCMAGGVGIWLVTLIQLHQHRLVSEERLEVAELERSRQEMLGGVKTIFDEEELDQMEKLAMGRRLRTIERFLVPVIGVLVAAYYLFVGCGLIPWQSFPNLTRLFPFLKQFSFVASADATPIETPTVILFFTGGLAFVCFMFSRYALGMARIREWALLRAGGNFFFGASAVNLAITIAMLCLISGMAWAETWLTRIIGVFLLVQAVETIINFVWDFYRPRVPGQIQRPFYDSRFLGMFSEPEGILRSMAKSLDYQFGFKVSETWFYRLLGRIIVPLILVQIAVIFLLTCITVVPPGHKAVIEHMSAKKEVVGPGVHLTWFWPVDKATIIPVEAVQRLEIGYERLPNEQESVEPAILWTKKHYKKEYLLLAADAGASIRREQGDQAAMRRGASGGAPPIQMLSMNMPVQWRVGDSDEDVLRFHAQSMDVPALLESLAFRELTRYAAQNDVNKLLGKGGIEAASNIWTELQKACDHAGYDGKGLGVKIAYVGIGGVHPPPDDDVAKSYEDVVSAYEEKDAKIKTAEGMAAEARIMSAGDEWDRLYQAIRAEDAARAVKSKDLPAKTAEVDMLLRSVVGGDARYKASRAERATFRRIFDVKSDAERYALQVDAFNAAPAIYAARSYLKLVANGLDKIRKYVLVMDKPERVLCEIDMKPPQALDILGAESAAIDAKTQSNQ